MQLITNIVAVESIGLGSKASEHMNDPIVKYIPVQSWNLKEAAYTVVSFADGYSTQFERRLSRRRAVLLATFRYQQAKISGRINLQ